MTFLSPLIFLYFPSVSNCLLVFCGETCPFFEWPLFEQADRIILLLARYLYVHVQLYIIAILYMSHGSLRNWWIIYSFREIYCESTVSVYDFYWEFNKVKYRNIAIFKEWLEKKDIYVLEDTWKSFKIAGYIHCSLHLNPRWQASQQRLVYLIFRNYKMIKINMIYHIKTLTCFPFPSPLWLWLYNSLCLFNLNRHFRYIYIVLLLQVSMSRIEILFISLTLIWRHQEPLLLFAALVPGMAGQEDIS